MRHPIPYVLRVEKGGGQLVYFGIRHTRDAGDPQLLWARRLMAALKPTIVLNEDMSAAPGRSLTESIKRDGERGALAFWAKEDRVRMESIDLDRVSEARQLDKRFPASWVKVFYLVRGLQQELPRRLKEDPHRTVDAVAASDLKDLAREGVGGSPSSVAELDKVWAGMHVGEDWRAPLIDWIEPNEKGPLNRISEASSEVRDRHMVSVLVGLLARGERVFAIVGASHVVMQEPALRGAREVRIVVASSIRPKEFRRLKRQNKPIP